MNDGLYEKKENEDRGRRQYCKLVVISLGRVKVDAELFSWEYLARLYSSIRKLKNIESTEADERWCQKNGDFLRMDYPCYAKLHPRPSGRIVRINENQE
jgi:hypothetical protein